VALLDAISNTCKVLTDGATGGGSSPQQANNMDIIAVSITLLNVRKYLWMERVMGNGGLNTVMTEKLCGVS